MATRRRNSTKSKAKQPKRQAKAGTPRPGGTGRKHTAGARKARSTTAARSAAARSAAARKAAEAAAAAPPVLRVAEPPIEDHDADWGGQGSGEPARTDGGATSWGTAETHHAAEDREAAEIARRVEEAAGGASDDFARRADAAARELGLRREAEERAADALRLEDQRELSPGVASLGIELAIGAFRIARAVATAPLRLGLAFLRR